MTQFLSLMSRVVPLVVDNIDTDQIIPARFLKTTDKDGLGSVLFCDWRYEDEVPDLQAAVRAVAKDDFALNDPCYQGAQILLAGDNFGCGSSREHAPWALVGWGFKAIVSTSFADIFRSNALKNSLLPVEIDRVTHAELAKLAAVGEGVNLTIDLPSQSIRLPDGRSVEFPIDAFSKRCLMDGFDQLGYLLAHEDAIATYEEERLESGI